MNKDLYAILGLSKDASESEIKKAYRRLAIKYHPDKQNGKSDAEKKEAEEKFKEVSWAYDILSDPDKKSRYDQFGITDDNQSMDSGFDASEIFKHFMGGMFGMQDDSPFGSFFNGRKSNQPTKGQSIRMQIPVDIKEIMGGVHRDIKYDINVRCSKCNGTGGTGVETCPHCHGTGMITETQRYGYQIIQNSHPCQYCHGTGTIIKHKCSECNGTGFKKKEVSVSVNINGGFDNGYQLLLEGKGYESKNPSYKNGDLLLEFIYVFDKNKFAIADHTIYEFVNVPYYDCILGKKFEHTLPNGDKVKVEIPEYTQDKKVIMTNKKYGINKYALVINATLPTYIRTKEKDLLKQIKKEND